jgi:hypothetical protein
METMKMLLTKRIIAERAFSRAKKGAGVEVHPRRAFQTCTKHLMDQRLWPLVRPQLHRIILRPKLNDGHAGMLLQEHVSVLLRSNIPPGWEEEMEAAGLVPEDEGAVSEGEEDTERDRSDDEDILVEYVSSGED